MTEARAGFENFVEGLLRTTGVLQTGTGHMRRMTLAPVPCLRRPPGKRERRPGFIDRLFRFENEKRIRFGRTGSGDPLRDLDPAFAPVAVVVVDQSVEADALFQPGGVHSDGGEGNLYLVVRQGPDSADIQLPRLEHLAAVELCGQIPQEKFRFPVGAQGEARSPERRLP